MHASSAVKRFEIDYVACELVAFLCGWRFFDECLQCQRQRQCELQQHDEHEHTRAALISFMPDLVDRKRSNTVLLMKGILNLAKF